MQAERAGLLVPPRWLVYLGNASYAIYLVHFLALSALAKMSKAAFLDEYVPAFVLFFMHVVGAIGVGCLFHHVVENPLHALTKRFFRRERKPVASESVAIPAMRKAA